MAADPALPGTGVARERTQPAVLVLAFSSALLIVIFGIFAFLVWQAYGQSLAQAEQRARAGSQLLAESVRLSVQVSLQFLEKLDGQATIDASELSAEIDRLVPGAHVAVYDASGGVSSGNAAPLAMAELPGEDPGSMLITFQEVTADGTRLGVARRFLNGSIGAIFIGKDMLARLRAPLGLGPASTASIVRSDGLVLSRDPPMVQTADLSGLPVFKTLSAGPEGSYLSPASPADGIARVVAFHALPELGLIVIASVSQDSVLRNLWTAAITVLWLMGPIALALIVGSLMTARLLWKSAATQARLTSALAHNETLLAEIHHRVKNNLQSVAALVQLQPIASDIKAQFAQRIAAMSAIHEHIYKSGDFGAVAGAAYLGSLITNIEQGLPPNIRVVRQLEPTISLDKDVAGHLGLMLNEAVSNVAKHAFPGGRPGTVVVELTRDDSGLVTLSIADDGVGYDVESPRKGTGRRIIKGIAAQIGGEATFTSSSQGSRVTFRFPDVARAPSVQAREGLSLWLPHEARALNAPDQHQMAILQMCRAYCRALSVDPLNFAAAWGDDRRVDRSP